MLTSIYAIILIIGAFQEKNFFYEQTLRELLKKEDITSGTVYIEHNPFWIATLPAKLDDVRINYVYNSALSKLKGRLVMYRIIPAHLEQGRLVVTIIKFEVTRRGKAIDLINIGGNTSFFSYDCGSKKYHLERALDEHH